MAHPTPTVTSIELTATAPPGITCHDMVTDEPFTAVDIRYRAHITDDGRIIECYTVSNNGDGGAYQAQFFYPAHDHPGLTETGIPPAPSEYHTLVARMHGRTGLALVPATGGSECRACGEDRCACRFGGDPA